MEKGIQGSFYFLSEHQQSNLLSLKDAAKWASQFLRRKITVSNISYLIQYGRIKNYGNGGNPLVNREELQNYYESVNKEAYWKNKLGKDINWHLSFSEYKESERTKHVHRLHPYKGKFIPQLVEYFLDSHLDEFKKQVYFHPGDIVLDPFCGSGTTLVQANELGLHAIGIDISAFNILLSKVKVEKHDLGTILKTIQYLSAELKRFQSQKTNWIFESKLLEELNQFNARYFPSPHYKIQVRNGEINEYTYGKAKEKEFLATYQSLVQQYQIQVTQKKQETFLEKWFLAPVREELDFLAEQILKVEDENIRNVLMIILSRTARSCRATTHADLATLKQPVTTTYYCKKHGKICKPIFSITGWWQTYTVDTLNRLAEFDKLRTNTLQICLTGDSRVLDIFREVEKINPDFAQLLREKKIKGIFSSPPYVGLIDYHEQHAYAYELFGLERRDYLEIGPLFKGQGEEARRSYVQGIAQVLQNCRSYLQEDFDIFLVANDKFNLYPQIASAAGMQIVNQFKRPVLNRVEKDRDTPYSEIIFHLKSQL